MTRMFLVFAVLAIGIGLAVQAWRTLSGREKWQLTKIAAFSIVCAALAVGLLTMIVILF